MTMYTTITELQDAFDIDTKLANMISFLLRSSLNTYTPQLGFFVDASIDSAINYAIESKPVIPARRWYHTEMSLQKSNAGFITAVPRPVQLGQRRFSSAPLFSRN